MKAQRMFKLSVVMAVGMIASQMALAQGVGNLGSLPTVFSGPNPPVGWNVVSSAGPIPVVLDPTGPAWGKSFTGPNGGPFVQPALGAPLPVKELLVVAGNKPWTDWHEDVIGVDASGAPDPGWSWANPSILVNGVTPTGLSITGTGTNSLSFFFNAVAPGSIVQISKDLVYNGIPGTAFIGTLAVHEYPTPEPATMGLLGLGSVIMLSRRRRIRLG
jgi:hypothetical protein